MATSEPRWSIAKLDGVRSHRPGANCFNAVLAGKGYSDYLRLTDAPELRYYLQRFCTRTPGLGKKGDILAVVRNEMLEHAAINLGNRVIFDKNSREGGVGLIDPDIRYGKRHMSQSDWFVDCEKPDCRVEAFKCESASKVRQAMASCTAKSTRMGFDVLFREFEFQTLKNSHLRVQMSEEARSAYYKLVDGLRTLNGNDECAPFILVQALSVIINWHILTVEGTRELNTLMVEARNRILSFDQSENTLKVMDESDWAPIWTQRSDRAQSFTSSSAK